MSLARRNNDTIHSQSLAYIGLLHFATYAEVFPLSERDFKIVFQDDNENISLFHDSWSLIVGVNL